MRLIDADALKEEAIEGLEKYWPYGGMTEFTAVSIDDIDNAPTIDAVPVIHCKDCAHWKPCEVKGFEGHKYCEWAGWLVGENAYCSYGEVKEHD